jgi:mannose-6-phosphate isomerase-like protein (cupin superfamily)
VAVTVNQSNVPREAFGSRAARQRLLTRSAVKSSRVLLDRWIVEGGGHAAIAVGRPDLAWCQVLEGEARLVCPERIERLTDAHVVFLPPGFQGRLESDGGATLLYAELPDAARFDPDFDRDPPRFRVLDWTREPVLDSKHDARKRIYIATPGLFGTRAIKGEMIIYPAGTAAANHHHEGAEHFMYVLKGRGTAYANENPIPVRSGDLIYYGDRERHYLRSDGETEMAFVEFFVPGIYKTVWAPGAAICTWLPTGRDIRGEKPARDIAAHSSAEATGPQDV